MPEQSKPPTTPRRIYAADLAVQQAGSTYYPHAEEWVEFIGRPSVGLYIKLVDLGRSPEGLALLHEHMSAWNWTNDAGEPYANPPALDDVYRMSEEELGWLLAYAGREPSDLKNASTPSTNRSTRRKAAKASSKVARLKSG